MKNLHLSSSLSLPIDFATQTAAIIARKRRGKTYTGSVLAEEMVAARLPFVAIDPTGAWWGLRASADGKKPGLPVTIIGGEHGDVPLERGAGKVIADLVVDHPGYYVLDVSDLDPEDMHFFCADFGERLFKRKKSKRFPMHLFGDEGDVLIPQVPENRIHNRCLKAYDKIIRRGGIYGLGFTVITQRPALVSKNALSQVEVLIVLQLIGAADRDAVEKWVKTHDTGDRAREFMLSLASLDLGEAWVWSPSWLDVFKRIKVRARHTFNSSKTPEVGDKLAEPAVLAPVDLEAIKSKVAATIEKAKENDPVELNRQIAALKAAAGRVPVSIYKDNVVEKRVEVPILRGGEIERLEKLVARIEKHLEKVGAASLEAQNLSDRLFEMIHPKPKEFVKAEGMPAQERAPMPHVTKLIVRQKFYDVPVQASDIGKAHQRVLNAVAWLERRGVGTPPRAQVAVLAGFTPGSGYFERVVGELRTKGCLAYPTGGMLALTNEGAAKADAGEAHQTTEAIQADVMRRIGPAHQKVLRAAIAAHPDDRGRADIATDVGMAPGSGYFERVVGELKTMGVMDYPDKGRLRASDILFVRS